MSQLVKFETAVLANKKGFDMPVIGWCYTATGRLKDTDHTENNSELEEWCTAPTQEALHAWLRKKSINLSMRYHFSNDTWGFVMDKVTENKNGIPETIRIDHSDKNYGDYETVYEIGLVEAMNMLDDKDLKK